MSSNVGRNDHLVVLLLPLGVAMLAPEARGEEAAAGCKSGQVTREIMGMDYQKSMKMEEPMPIGMARPGMKKGDVKAKAGEKETAIKKMMCRRK